MTNIEAMAQHVTDLCKAFNIVAEVRPDMKPEQASSGHLLGTVPYVKIPPVVDDTSYAVALHEIGHMLAPLGSFRHTEITQKFLQRHPAELARLKRLRLDEEYAAWEWAKHHALDWTTGMEQVYRYAIGTYESGISYPGRDA